MPLKKKPVKNSSKKAPKKELEKPLKPKPTDPYLKLLEMAKSVAHPDLPPAPAWIGKYGVLEWYELGSVLQQEGMFSGHLDYSFFEKYCNQHDTYVEMCRAIYREGKMLTDPTGVTGYSEPNPKLRMADSLLKNLMTMSHRLGITPMSRNQMDIKDKEEYNRLKSDLGISTPNAVPDTRGRKPKGF